MDNYPGVHVWLISTIFSNINVNLDEIIRNDLDPQNFCFISQRIAYALMSLRKIVTSLVRSNIDILFKFQFHWHQELPPQTNVHPRASLNCWDIGKIMCSDCPQNDDIIEFS